MVQNGQMVKFVKIKIHKNFLVDLQKFNPFKLNTHTTLLSCLSKIDISNIYTLPTAAALPASNSVPPNMMALVLLNFSITKPPVNITHRPIILGLFQTPEIVLNSTPM